MTTQIKPRVRKTPNGRHLYVATLKGYATYGWGNTPDEARVKLAEMIVTSGESQPRPATDDPRPPTGDDR